MRPQPSATAPGKQAAKPEKPKIWSDLAAAFSNVKNEREWFAEGAIEGDPLVIFTAPEKSGKSWILLDLAVATVTGGAWLGAFPIRRPGPVVYVDAELGPFEFARRLARVARGRGFDPLVVMKGLRHLSEQKAAGLLDLDVYKDSGDAGRRLLSAMSAEQPALLIIDPYRNMLPGHENDSLDTKRAGRVLRGLRDAIGVPVIVAHHLNKQGSFAGSRALRALADQFSEGTDDTPSWYSTIGRTLRRDDAITRRFTVAIEHEDDQRDEVAKTRVRIRFEGERAGEAALSKTALRVLDALKDEPAAVPAGRLQKVLKRNAPIVKGALEELRQAGLVTQKGTVWEISGTEFLADVAQHAGLELVTGQPGALTTGPALTTRTKNEVL